MSVIIRLVSENGRETAAVSTFGARVQSWHCRNRERLFMPPAAAVDDRSAPHGGIPVLFPQFGFFGPGRKHGVVRDLEWAIDDQADDFVLMSLNLEAAEHVPSAALKLRVEIEAGALTTFFAVTNTSTEAIRFTHGLHTYLRVDDINGVRLTGLEKTPYQDALQGLKYTTASGTPVESLASVDRIYSAAPASLELIDQEERIRIAQTGFADTVVWNPGPDLASQLTDLADDEWRHFLCIEAAQISPPVELPAWDTWYGRQRLQVTGA